MCHSCVLGRAIQRAILASHSRLGDGRNREPTVKAKMTETFTETRQGFTFYGLRNDIVEVVVVPELGAKISSLRYRQTGREWMWSPPDGPTFFRNRSGDPFEESTIVGADECIPTIAPCTWRDRHLPDHGEAWSNAWTLDETAFAHGRISTHLQLPVSPLRLERTLSLTAAGVQMDYRLQNSSDGPYEYVWALHPLMAIQEGDTIVLPAECETVRTDSMTNSEWEGRGVVLNWPSPAADVRFDRLELGRKNAAAKLFTDPLTQGRAAIRNRRSGEYIAFLFDPEQLNTLGVWINRGGWNSFQHVALEPTNGAPDPLDQAVNDWQRFSRLDPGAIQAWHLNLIVGIDRGHNDEQFLRQLRI